MNNALIITSVASMVAQFLIPNISLLKTMGYNVQVACNFEKGSTCGLEQVEELKQLLDEQCVVFHQIGFERDVLKVACNKSAYDQLFNIISNNNFDLIHCHSPVGGLIGRLAARKFRKKGTKVYYTAHGFHFYKGAPLKNWMCYYPVEKLCSYLTDVLITINHEDYVLAVNKMKSKRIEYIPGVGIDLSRFDNVQVDKTQKRRDIGVPEDAILLISVGELSERKNHKIVLQALSEIDDEKVHYVICGKGELLQELQKCAKEYNIEQRVHFLGYRKDIAEIYTVSDICVFPSIQEGLPVALMEAMASGLPAVCSNIRGNTDLMGTNDDYLFDPHNAVECRNTILKALSGDMKIIGTSNKERAQEYSIENIMLRMKSIYES